LDLINIGFRFKYLISAAVAKPDLIKQFGYKPFKIFKSGVYSRGIYDNISTEDAINFCSFMHMQYVPKAKKYSNKIIRAILLVKGYN
jgi:hypothetical protein